MDFADRKFLCDSINVSDAGMQVRKSMALGKNVAKADPSSSDPWRSPLDDIQTPVKTKRELSGDQLRLKNLLRPYSHLGRTSN